MFGLTLFGDVVLGVAAFAAGVYFSDAVKAIVAKAKGFF